MHLSGNYSSKDPRLSKHLRHQRANRSIEWFDLRAETLTQFTWREMKVEPCGFDALVTSNQSNIIETHSCPFQDRTALMAQGVRRERWQANLCSHPFDDFVEGTNAEGATWITGGF